MRLTRLLFCALFFCASFVGLHAQSTTTATVLRPYITSISPQSLLTGVDSTLLTINGKRFQRGAAVYFNARKLSNVRIDGDSVIVAVVPGELTVNADVAVLLVENPDETRIGMRVNISPGLCSPFGRPSEWFGGIQPTVTTASTKPFTVQVLGIGFAGNIRIVLGGVELLVLSTSSTQITAQVPADFASGVHWLQVIQREVCILGRFLFINPFDPNALPTITGISPTAIFESWKPTTLTITGTNFLMGVRVLFGNVPLTIIMSSNTQIVAIVPPNLETSTYQVTVINPDGQQAVRNIFLTTTGVEAAPIATTLSPNPVTTDLTLETTLDRAATLTLTLRNILGEAVLQERHTAASGRFAATLDVSTLANGVYLLEVSDGAGGRWVQKVVKY